MQEQNLEEWKEKIDRSAEQITVPDTLTPGAVQQMLEERKNRTSAGRKEQPFSVAHHRFHTYSIHRFRPQSPAPQLPQQFRQISGNVCVLSCLRMEKQLKGLR